MTNRKIIIKTCRDCPAHEAYENYSWDNYGVKHVCRPIKTELKNRVLENYPKIPDFCELEYDDI